MGAKSSVTYTARDADVIATGIAGLLSGDVAIVTGAAQGNGAGIARGLAQSGAAVPLADTDLDGALVVASDITRAGGMASAVALDVADRAQCADVARKAQEQYGPVSILINNVGIFRRAEIDTPEFLESAALQWRVNVEGSLNMAQALVAQLRQTQGRIVNIASIASFIAYRRNVVGYAASKGAVVQLTKGLAADLAANGIRVSAIAPGLIATPLTAALRSQPAVMEELFAHALMKRFAEPEELVGAVLSLTSRLSTFVTGAIMPVDGGFLAI